VQNGAALRARGGEQEFEPEHMRGELTRRLRETPKGVGIEEYFRAIPATHMHVVDGIPEI
jgi:hypothetical protein